MSVTRPSSATVDAVTEGSPPSSRFQPANRLDGLIAPSINTLSKALVRAAAQHARAACGLSQVEWQVITLLGVFEPISIRELADVALLDAAQISRAVSALAHRGLIERRRSQKDLREAVLLLTADGRSVRKRLSAAAHKLNTELVQGVSDADMATFFRLMALFVDRAREQLGLDAARLRTSSGSVAAARSCLD